MTLFASRKWLTLVAIQFLVMPVCSQATSVPASMRYDSLLESQTIDNLSIGAAYRRIHRKIHITDQLRAIETIQTLKAQGADLYVGWDTASWMTIFTTLGAAELMFENFSPRFKWSAGAGVNLWHHDIRDPLFMAGRVTIKSLAEYAAYESISAGNREEDNVQWNQFDAVLLFGYERVENRLVSPETIRLNLFAGPAFSRLDGKGRGDRMRIDISEKSSAGFVVGAEIKLSEYLTFFLNGTGYLGAGEHTMSSWSAGSRFHF